MEYSWETGSNTDIWSNAKFESIEECIDDALSYGIKAGETIYVGECKEYVIGVDADSVLEKLSQDAFEEVGEVADGWPTYKRNELEDLADALTAYVCDWLQKRNDMPTFYKIENIREVEMEELYGK